MVQVFLKDNNFLIGISIDGPEHCQNVYRNNKGDSGTFAQEMRGIGLLQKHEVDFNTLSVINDYNIQFPLDLYRILKEIGSQNMLFSPIVERISDYRPDGLKPLPPEENIDAELAFWTVNPVKFGQFYIDIFDEWVRNDLGTYFIQLFDALLANMVGGTTRCLHFCRNLRPCGSAVVQW